MTWVFFSLLSAFLWACGNIGDKYMLSGRIKRPETVLISYSFMAGLFALVILAFEGTGQASFGLAILAALSGAFYILPSFLYYKAIQLEEVSRVIPIVFLEPLFTAGMSAIFLSEILTPYKYLGVGLMVLGSVFISYKKQKGIKFGKGMKLAFFGAIFFAVSLIFIKYLVDRMGFWDFFVYSKVGSFVGILPVCYFYYSSFKELKDLKPSNWILISVVNALPNLASLTFAFAASLGYIALTSALAATQPFFVLAMATLVGIFYPHFFEEEVGKKVFVQKLLATIIMFLGVVLVTS